MTRFRITPLNRPVEDQAWRREPSSPERQARSEAYQKQQDALRRQFESEWVPPPGYSAERDLEEMENIKSAAFTVWEEQRTGRTVAASTPSWEDKLEDWLIDGSGRGDHDGLLARLPTAASLTLPFVLQGGGDMQLTFETKKVFDPAYDTETHTWLQRELRLLVRTEQGVYVGRLTRECGERRWSVISLPSSAPQEVADRIASTLDAVNTLSLPDDYLIVMPVSSHCSICARPLTDIVSKTLGIGPDCAHKLIIPHSTAIADAIVTKRRAWLSDATAV